MVLENNEDGNQKPKYNIVLCEIYNPFIHGPPSQPNINSHYLVIDIFQYPNYELYNSDDDVSDDDSEFGITTDLDTIKEIHQMKYNSLKNTVSYDNSISKHSLIRNYQNIIESEDYIQPEIAQCIYIDGTCLAIKKTFWLRIFQRKWKRIYQYKQEILKKRMKYESLLHRELKGKWPINCY